MKRIKLVISYDGTKYNGWQKQPNGTAIEEIINDQLSELLGETIEIIGASRTDSGVHALGNVAVFDTVTKIPPDKICFALNQRLPSDIVIQSSCEVSADFHPRKCDCEKTYEYKILNRKHPQPMLRNYAYFVYLPLDLDAMRQGASYLVGMHDFRSFCSSHSQARSTVRTIYELNVDKENDIITIRIRGNGFLYNMVRIIVGTLVKVGLHVYPPEHVCEILMARDRSIAGPKAPAAGLTLVEIDYN